MKVGLINILGFSMLIIGFLSILLMMMGLRLSYLSFIDSQGDLLGLVVRITMIIVGIILIYFSRVKTNMSDFEQQK